MEGLVTITADFSIKTFDITATAGDGGDVDPASNTVNWGESSTVDILAQPFFYTISQVYVDGVNVGAVDSYTFNDVQADHTLQAFFQKRSSSEDAGGTVDVNLNLEEVSVVAEVLNGTASLDLPPDLLGGTVSFDVITPVDLGCLIMGNGESGNVTNEVASVEPGGKFLCGVSFDVVTSSDSENVGLLPVDLEVVISEDQFSTGCLEAIADESGNFLVGLGLLIADAPSGAVSAVHAVPANGDCRFLVFDGADDGHYRDPIGNKPKEIEGRVSVDEDPEIWIAQESDQRDKPGYHSGCPDIPFQKEVQNGEETTESRR